jgi:hypothetical protein
MQGFGNRKVWEKAHGLRFDVYASSKAFPREEIYGFTSQMRRASASIGANIAEGCCGRAIPMWAGLCKLRWGLPANGSTTVCWLVI